MYINHNNDFQFSDTTELDEDMEVTLPLSRLTNIVNTTGIHIYSHQFQLFHARKKVIYYNIKDLWYTEFFVYH